MVCSSRPGYPGGAQRCRGYRALGWKTGIRPQQWCEWMAQQICKPEFDRFPLALDVKALSAETGEIEGYGSVFDVVDSYGEVVKSTAFDRSLAEARSSGRMPAMLWQHRQDEPIGVWTEMAVDTRGLRVKGRLLLEGEPLAQRALAHLKNGSVSGLSIGYISQTLGANGRDILDLELKEVSLVTIPANSEARVDRVKRFNCARDIADTLRAGGMTGGLAKREAGELWRKHNSNRYRDEEQAAIAALVAVNDRLRRM